MSKVTNFFQNPFNEPFNEVKDGAKVEKQSRTANQANELFKDKPFATENKTTYNIAKIIKYVANVISFATAFFALRAVLGLILGTHIANLGAFTICALIELLKNASWKTNVKQYLRYNKPSFVGWGVLFLLSLLSIGASLYGAYLIPSELEPPSLIAYSNNDSLVLNELNLLNTQLSNQDKLLIETSAKAIPDKNGKISSTFKTLLTKQNAQKDSLSSQKRALNERIAQIGTTNQTSNKDAIQAHKNGLFNMQISCVIVALLFELLYTLCCIYCFYYLFRVYIDSNLNQTHQAPQHQSPPAYNQATQHTPTNQTNKIGYFNSLPTNQTNVQTQQKSGLETVLKPFDNGVLEVENGIKFVWNDGKKYTKSDIQNNIYAFKAKCKTYQNLQDTAKLQRYKAHLQKWQNYLNLVNG